ncbi:MAG: hypothetical protein WB801_11060 [Candidatus Dormiibacterota bacterium]
MAAIALIAAIGIFAVGIVVGIIAMVTHGIHRERRRYQEIRRYRDEHGLWDDPEYFLTDEAPDGVSLAARRFNGLYVRRPTVHSNDAELVLQG